MFHKQMTGVFILGFVLFLNCQAAYTAQSDTRIKVGISPFSPFVIFSEEEPTGLSIDLWQALSRETGLDFEFVKYEGVADKLKNLQEGSIDIAIGGITITEKREEMFDFTHPALWLGCSTGIIELFPEHHIPDIAFPVVLKVLIIWRSKIKIIYNFRAHSTMPTAHHRDMLCPIFKCCPGVFNGKSPHSCYDHSFIFPIELSGLI